MGVYALGVNYHVKLSLAYLISKGKELLLFLNFIVPICIHRTAS